MDIVSTMCELAQRGEPVNAALLNQHADSLITALTGVDLHPCSDMSAAEEAAEACGAMVYLGMASTCMSAVHDKLAADPDWIHVST